MFVAANFTTSSFSLSPSCPLVSSSAYGFLSRVLTSAIFIIGSSCACASFVSISAGFKLWGTQRSWPFSLERESWITAASKVVLSSSPHACSEAPESKTLLASTTATCLWVQEICVFWRSLLLDLWALLCLQLPNTKRDKDTLLHIATCFSRAPKEVGSEMDSQSAVLPALRLTLRLRQESKDIGTRSTSGQLDECCWR